MRRSGLDAGTCISAMLHSAKVGIAAVVPAQNLEPACRIPGCGHQHSVCISSSPPPHSVFLHLTGENHFQKW